MSIKLACSVIKFLLPAAAIGFIITCSVFYVMVLLQVEHQQLQLHLDRNYSVKVRESLRSTLVGFKFPLSEQYLITSKVGVIYIVSIGCDIGMVDSLISIKSAILYSPDSVLHIIIFTEEENFAKYSQTLSHWQIEVNQTFYFTILKPIFPSEHLKKLFKTCASLRLFLPDLLPNIDAALYLDIDTLFLAPPKLLWSKLSSFNNHHLAGMVLENETTGFYDYGKIFSFNNSGLNSGVILMNLTRMRTFGWTDRALALHERQQRRGFRGWDQDVINLIFYYHPERVLVLPCTFNFMYRHCLRSNRCLFGNSTGVNVSDQQEEEKGVVIVHGNNMRLHQSTDVNFTWIYDEMVEIALFDGDQSNSLQNLEKGRHMLCQYNETFQII